MPIKSPARASGEWRHRLWILTCAIALLFTAGCGADSASDDNGGSSSSSSSSGASSSGDIGSGSSSGDISSSSGASSSGDISSGSSSGDVSSSSGSSSGDVSSSGASSSSSGDVSSSSSGMDMTVEPPLPPGEVTGTVWAPGNAPGMVPPGQEIPIFNAQVYLLEERPSAIPQGAYCELCTGVQPGLAVTDHQGHFTLVDQAPGTYWFIVQKGQFRLERQITVESDQTLTLNAAQTTLPSSHDPDSGFWIPRIAIAAGSYDHLEDIFGKMGIGEVDDAGQYVPSSASGNIDVWYNGSSRFTDFSIGDFNTLVSDLSLLMQYHVIFIPCSGTTFTAALQDQQVLQNIRDYVSAGGKLYVTDWSGEWHDNVFPTQIELESGEDTPSNAYDPATETWNTALFGGADGSPYDSPNASAYDADLYDWLHGQQGPTAFSTTSSVYDAGSFEVEGNWNTIESLTTVSRGTDPFGEPILDVPVSYVEGGKDTDLTPKPLTVTYEPAGCGRVLYSTYHTTDSTHVGIVPQERVLLYLIMEIGTCQKVLF